MFNDCYVFPNTSKTYYDWILHSLWQKSREFRERCTKQWVKVLSVTTVTSCLLYKARDDVKGELKCCEVGSCGGFYFGGCSNYDSFSLIVTKTIQMIYVILHECGILFFIKNCFISSVLSNLYIWNCSKYSLIIHLWSAESLSISFFNSWYS